MRCSKQTMSMYYKIMFLWYRHLALWPIRAETERYWLCQYVNDLKRQAQHFWKLYYLGTGYSL